ncbi:hypothetical protein CSUNSWCD_1584 [Campylobacter showae CSUNSWCD]|uniref:Uncharacterized protein n=1 Tax=Campylobacter showae CSUNSWCD TaxID=1244083 RepID=M5IR17_9BACT|nr:hypothetical protein CSUNSWCD_1584 [Campylobacter showae CSUNSWCD]
MFYLRQNFTSQLSSLWRYEQAAETWLKARFSSVNFSYRWV